MDDSNENINMAFFTFYSLPSPLGAHSCITATQSVSLRANDDKTIFLVPLQQCIATSDVIQGLLEDAGEGDVLIPLSVPCATPYAVALIASWLNSVDCSSAPPSAQIPVQDVSESPGTTGMRGSQIVALAMKDSWSRTTLSSVFPLLSHSIQVNRSELQADCSTTDTMVSLDITIGVKGLRELYEVAQLAVFLGIRRLSELCCSYILHGLQEALRDERAFGVQQRTIHGVPPNNTRHIAHDIIERSCATHPAYWDMSSSAASHPQPAVTIPDDTIHWLRQSCTGMTL